jgi:hypothetical protein
MELFDEIIHMPETPEEKDKQLDVGAGERLDIEFADGHVAATADGGDRKAQASPKRARKRDSENPGTLL